MCIMLYFIKLGLSCRVLCKHLPLIRSHGTSCLLQSMLCYAGVVTSQETLSVFPLIRIWFKSFAGWFLQLSSIAHTSICGCLSVSVLSCCVNCHRPSGVFVISFSHILAFQSMTYGIIMSISYLLSAFLIFSVAK